jgi:hypothetical protein
MTQIAATKHEGAANKAMYALGSVVRSPVPLARSQFYAQAGLGQLQSLLGQAAGASLRVRSKAINLIADLIEMTANGDDESLETWDEKVGAVWDTVCASAVGAVLFSPLAGWQHAAAV